MRGAKGSWDGWQEAREALQPIYAKRVKECEVRLHLAGFSRFHRFGRI